VPIPHRIDPSRRARGLGLPALCPTRARRRLPRHTLGILAALTAGAVLSTTVPAAGTAPETTPPTAAATTSAGEAFGRLPLVFEENLGQLGNEARFLARSPYYQAYLTPAEVILVLRGEHRVSLTLDGAHAAPRITGERPTGGQVSYLVGPREQWHSAAALFDQVRYAQVYPGIDVVYYGNDRRLEYDFVVAPGTSPDAIALRFAGTDGVEIEAASGDLLLHTPAGVVRHQRPIAFQAARDGTREPVEAAYVEREDGSLRIEVGEYDTTRELTIDPVLVFSTYLGGTGGEWWDQSRLAGIALDTGGNIVAVGDTTSGTFLGVANPVDLTTPPTAQGQRVIFVARMTPTGSRLLSLTFFGGHGLDDAPTLALGGDNSIYIAARTTSTNLPVTAGAAQPTPGGGGDGFVTKLNPTGTAILWMTYLGGSQVDAAEAIRVDPLGQAVVAGYTASPDFPTTNAIGPLGSADAFVVKFNATGTARLFSTRFGGTAWDEAMGLVLGAGGEIFVSGQTRSADFPTVNPLRATLTGTADPFLAVLDPTATVLLASTYFGGSGPFSPLIGTLEFGRIAPGPGGSIYMVGATDSPDFPVQNAVQPTYGGGASDGFAARFNWSAGALSLVYSTYLGGVGDDSALAVVADATGVAHITGATRSVNFPPPIRAFDPALTGFQDAFYLRLGPSGNQILEATYLGGGTGTDVGLAITIDGGGDAYILGQTTANDFPVREAVAGSLAQRFFAGGGQDGFVVRLSTSPPEGAPNVLRVTPGYGFTGGGTPVRISGTGFQAGAVVFFGGVPAANVVVLGPTSITAVTPPGPAGPVSVVVRNPDTLEGGLSVAFIYSADTDGDGLPDAWEIDHFGNLGQGPNDDPDRDGISNRDEWLEGSDPNIAVRYFAEGATEGLFETRYALFNPHEVPMSVVMTFQRLNDTNVVHTLTLLPSQRATVIANNIPGLGGSFSTTIESRYPVVADRTMTWDMAQGYGSHSETSIGRRSTVWYLAEGAANPFFRLYYLLQNPNDVPVQVTLTYLLAAPNPPVTRTLTLPPLSRTNIEVHNELNTFEVSGVIQASEPIIVERAMYLQQAGRPFFYAGHNSAGVTAPQTRWLLAEGSTGPFFDTYVLLANPSPGDATVRLTFLLSGGRPPLTKQYVVAGNSRRTIYLDGEEFNGQYLLANEIGVSTIVEVLAGPAVIAERAMWFPGPLTGPLTGDPSVFWEEAHNSPGAIVTGTRWALADGEAGGMGDVITYALIANTSTFAGRFQVQVFFQEALGLPQMVSQTFNLAAEERKTLAFPVPAQDAVEYGPLFTAFQQRLQLQPRARFSIVITSLPLAQGDPSPQIVVERSMYSCLFGQPGCMPNWPAGTNALGTRLLP
jgi:hypothetical protein